MSPWNTRTCRSCGQEIPAFQNPTLTVDIIIETGGRDEAEFILIKRKDPPYGWALPGGFVDYNESVERAAIREAKEETNLDISIKDLLGVYSEPNRDPRGHTVSIVFVGGGEGDAQAKDDALELAWYTAENLPEDIVFDHKQIISDYLKARKIAQT